MADANICKECFAYTNEGLEPLDCKLDLIFERFVELEPVDVELPKDDSVFPGVFVSFDEGRSICVNHVLGLPPGCKKYMMTVNFNKCYFGFTFKREKCFIFDSLPMVFEYMQLAFENWDSILLLPNHLVSRGTKVDKNRYAERFRKCDSVQKG